MQSQPDDANPEQNDAIDNDVHVVRSPVLRGLLIVVGLLSTVLGIVGIFLPLLPTTPFLLLAAACFARSSERFYRWLLSNRWFGQYIRDWRAGKGIPLRAKVVAITSIVLVLGSSIVFFVPVLAGKIVLGLIGLAVIVHLLRLPTRRPSSAP